MNWKKNIQRILEGCACYAQNGKSFTLALAGQGPDVNSIQQKVDELGLTERVRFTGHITNEEDLYGLYEVADLFVFPSLYDTSGMVVREAAAMGTPSVVVRGCATAEPILDRENGFLCEDTTQSLCDVIDLALSDSAMTSKIGQSARKTIYLSWDEIATASVERYAALIERKKKISKKP
jgi:glycosyltransferase involved in cell wall biosynthesis